METGYEIARAAVVQAQKVIVDDDGVSSAVCAAIVRVIGRGRYLDPEATFTKADRLRLLEETDRQAAKVIADRGVN